MPDLSVSWQAVDRAAASGGLGGLIRLGPACFAAAERLARFQPLRPFTRKDQQ